MTVQAEKTLEIKKDWLSALEKLMTQIKQWVSDPQWKEITSIKEHYAEKEEEYLGNYKVPVLFISGKNSLVEVRPVGRFAIGAIGRVDIILNKNCFSLLYSSRKGWICLENRKPLTKDLFYELLGRCVEAYPAHENSRLH